MSFLNRMKTNRTFVGYLILVLILLLALMRVEQIASEQRSLATEVTQEICSALERQGEQLLALVESTGEPDPIPDSASPELREHLAAVQERNEQFRENARELFEGQTCQESVDELKGTP